MRRFARRMGRIESDSTVQAEVLRALRLGRRPPNSALVSGWRSTVQKLLPLGGLSTGNRISLFTDGDAAFLSMWHAISTARERVWLETYTLEPDAVGLRTLALLEEAAKRGCDVRLLYDAVGSWHIEEKHVAQLQALGGKVRAFHPLRADWPWRLSSYLYRNHRKTLSIDDDVAFCGGMNCGGHYCSPAIGGNSYFTDVHVRVEGPACADVREVFLDSMREAEKHSPALHDASVPITLRRWLYNSSLMTRVRKLLSRGTDPLAASAVAKKKKAAAADALASVDPVVVPSSLVQVLVSNVRAEKMHIQRALPLAIRNSHSRCYITSPYFLPPRRVRNALIEAAARGVDVRVVTAGRTDVALAKWAGRHLYSLFVHYGVKVYELKQSALHAKLCVLDDVYTTLGSFNLDVLSHTRNLEVSMHVLDPKLAQAARAHMETYMAASRLITAEELETRSWPARVLHWAAYQISRLPQVYRSPIIGDDVS